MIFLPSRGRRKSLELFFKASKPTLPGRVIIDRDDRATYAGMILPEGWDWIIGERAPLVTIFNRAYNLFPNEPWYGAVGDDCIFSPEGWDVRSMEQVKDRYLVYGDDGVVGDALCTHFFISGDLVRHMGWFMCPEFGHLYGDTIWYKCCKATGLLKYDPTVKFRHARYPDNTFLSRSITGDAKKYQSMQKDGKLDKLIERAVQFTHILEQQCSLLHVS